MEHERYTGTRLKSVFSIEKVYTIHFFEYVKNYKFHGERHDFWEMIYVDKGSINLHSDSTVLKLVRGEAYFHRPSEWHNVETESEAADTIVISFECRSESMDFFKRKIITVTNEEKKLLGSIISESRDAFKGPFDNPYSKKLIRRKDANAESEQMIKILIEQLLISIRRNNTSSHKNDSLLKKRYDDDIVDSAIDYLSRNTSSRIKFSDVLDYIGTSSTTLKTLFSSRMGCGVMDYFNRLKIERAKRYIREEKYNFTQISSLLGYDSLHYFSRQFKKKTGMTPTEYANSVRVIIDNNS